MRIVQISTCEVETPPRFGGAIETYVDNVSTGLSQMGHDVHVLGLKNPRRSYGEYTFHSIQTARERGHIFSFTLPYGSHSIPKMVLDAREISSRLLTIENSYGPIDIIHSHFLQTALGCFFPPYVRMEAKTPIFLHLHNLIICTPFNRMVLTFFVKHVVDRILSVSSFVKKKIEQEYDFLENRVHIVHNGININEFSSKATVDTEKFKLLRPFFLFVGRISPQKGVHYVLDAMSMLKKNGFDREIRFVVVGPVAGFGAQQSKHSAYSTFLHKRTRELGLNECVHFLGRVSKPTLINLYKTAEFVVVPSIFGDPCPTVVLEAGASGTPVIAFQDGGIPELIDHEKTGLLVKSRDTKQLAQAIQRLMSNPSEAERMGIHAETNVRRYFTYKAIVRNLLQEYKEALSGRTQSFL